MSWKPAKRRNGTRTERSEDEESHSHKATQKLHRAEDGSESLKEQKGPRRRNQAGHAPHPRQVRNFLRIQLSAISFDPTDTPAPSRAFVFLKTRVEDSAALGSCVTARLFDAAGYFDYETRDVSGFDQVMGVGSGSCEVCRAASESRASRAFSTLSSSAESCSSSAIHSRRAAL